MAKKNQDCLEVFDDFRGNYRLHWWLPEEEDYGAVVGEGGEVPTRDKSTDIEWYTAEVVCFQLHKATPDSDTFGLDSTGFWWSSKSRASSALAQIRSETRVALQAKGGSEASWPEWAVTAKVNGWKPPKGWKP